MAATGGPGPLVEATDGPARLETYIFLALSRRTSLLTKADLCERGVRQWNAIKAARLLYIRYRNA